VKKNGASVGLFLVVFLVTYLFMCYGIPGMRIKLAAEPVAYFLASIRHMVLVKTVVSLLAALIVSAIPAFPKK
jgi:hypothetical protein